MIENVIQTMKLAKDHYHRSNCKKGKHVIVAVEYEKGKFYYECEHCDYSTKEKEIPI